MDRRLPDDHHTGGGANTLHPGSGGDGRYVCCLGDSPKRLQASSCGVRST